MEDLDSRPFQDLVTALNHIKYPGKSDQALPHDVTEKELTPMLSILVNLCVH